MSLKILQNSQENTCATVFFNKDAGGTCKYIIYNNKACIIHCFHEKFVFDSVFDTVLIVVYAPGIHLSEVKVKYFSSSN